MLSSNTSFSNKSYFAFTTFHSRWNHNFSPPFKVLLSLLGVGVDLFQEFHKRNTQNMNFHLCWNVYFWWDHFPKSLLSSLMLDEATLCLSLH